MPSLEPCPTCGSDVLKLPYGDNPDVLLAIEPREVLTSYVPEPDRWAFLRGVGLVCLDGVLTQPTRCFVIHPCSKYFANRGSGSTPTSRSTPTSPSPRAPRDPDRPALKGRQQIIERGRETDRRERERAHQRRYGRDDPNHGR
ncbi:hypothetical protein [Actinosynnema sp. NPDC023587]|uniref:hypothetical protein n=1 Tax=Actinosynnema sp. NPDC023587 TaxID=3154695 RepID=UPI0033F9B615